MSRRSESIKNRKNQFCQLEQHIQILFGGREHSSYQHWKQAGLGGDREQRGRWNETRLEKCGGAVWNPWEAMVTSMSRYLKESIFILPLSSLLAHPMPPTAEFHFLKHLCFYPVTSLLQKPSAVFYSRHCKTWTQHHQGFLWSSTNESITFESRAFEVK